MFASDVEKAFLSHTVVWIGTGNRSLSIIGGSTPEKADERSVWMRESRREQVGGGERSLSVACEDKATQGAVMVSEGSTSRSRERYRSTHIVPVSDLHHVSDSFLETSSLIRPTSPPSTPFTAPTHSLPLLLPSFGIRQAQQRSESLPWWEDQVGFEGEGGEESCVLKSCFGIGGLVRGEC